jgi:methylated-DNA-[protein]-cysteine S-methyltransferase
MPALWTTHDTPLGELTLVGDAGRLSGLRFPGADPLDGVGHRPGAFAAARRQLDEFFAGDRRHFDLDVDLVAGTDFQRRVWRRLLEIPYGATMSYTALAGAIGRPDRARAVGAAVGRTPVPIIVPCHRVVGANGSLTGYGGGGLPRKRALLDLEAGRLTLGGPQPEELTPSRIPSAAAFASRWTA